MLWVRCHTNAGEGLSWGVGLPVPAPEGAVHRAKAGRRGAGTPCTISPPRTGEMSHLQAHQEPGCAPTEPRLGTAELPRPWVDRTLGELTLQGGTRGRGVS